MRPKYLIELLERAKSISQIKLQRTHTVFPEMIDLTVKINQFFEHFHEAMFSKYALQI